MSTLLLFKLLSIEIRCGSAHFQSFYTFDIILVLFISFANHVDLALCYSFFSLISFDFCVTVKLKYVKQH